ncbi:hypothetical protein BC567DRAFT_230686 [Phyllosticta citribraziliensis]
MIFSDDRTAVGMLTLFPAATAAARSPCRLHHCLALPSPSPPSTSSAATNAPGLGTAVSWYSPKACMASHTHVCCT